MCPRSFSAMPGPESSTVTRSAAPSRAVRMTSVRGPAWGSRMASRPLSTRFSTTCWSCTRSPRAFGRSDASSRLIDTLRMIVSLLMSHATAPTTSLRSSGTNSGSPFLIRARSPLITAAARLSSATISHRISRTFSSSTTSAARRRWAACALLRIAVSGWLSSWASDAVSSPRAETRPMWVRSCRSRKASSSLCLRDSALAKTSPRRWSCWISSSDFARSAPTVLKIRPPTTIPLTSRGTATCGLTRFTR